DKYTIPEQVKLRYILVSSQGRSAAETRKLAEEARAKLVANENFAAVADAYSGDRRFRSNRGEIGPLPYGKLPAEIPQAPKTMKVGEVSPLIESPNGYYIATITLRTPEKTHPFDSVKAQIIAAEETKYAREQVDKKLGEFLDKQTEYYLDNIDAMRVDI